MQEKPRIAFKPHLRAHVLSNVEVALIGETRRYALRARAYAVLAPLLDGTKTADQIVAAVDGELAPEMAFFALERLRARGYTTECRSGELEPWSAWWLAHGEDEAARIATMAEARVCVTSLGLTEQIAEAFAAKISQSVRMVDTHATFEVCLVDDYLRAELGQRIASALAAGRTLLPIRPVGAWIWLGPFCRPEDPPDWPPFEARLRSNRPADIAVLAQRRSFPLMPTVSTPETMALGLSLAAVVVARCAASDIPPAIDRAIWTFDTRTLEARSHALPSRARALTSPAGEAGTACPIDLTRQLKRYTSDGGHRVCPPDETLARLTPLVSPITGIVPDIEKLPGAAGVFVYGAAQTEATPACASPRRNRILGRPDGAAGKGQTDIQARVSCLAEAVERYCCWFFEDLPRRTARFSELGTDAVHPDNILLFSARQYAEREARNKEHGEGFNWIPEPFDAEHRIEWTPVWSLTSQRTRWVPTALCYFAYDPSTEYGVPRFARACSNGCAAGNSIEEAILQGVLELVERDACALWWYNRVQRPAIDLVSFREPYFDAMQQYHRAQGRVLHVLDLRTDLDIPVAKAVSWRAEDGGEIQFGLGCSLEPRVAVSRALSELNQVMAEKCEEGPALQRSDDRHLGRWLREATIENQPHMVPLQRKLVDASDFEDRSSDDIATDIRLCVDRLHELGHETLVLDHTRPDVGFPTARVIAPGLRHFWARLAPGRLYDVPVSLGWIERAQDEDELNPIPFFL